MHYKRTFKREYQQLNLNVNKGKMQWFWGGNSSHLANSCKYINTICNLWQKRGHLDWVCKNKSNNYKVNECIKYSWYIRCKLWKRTTSF